MYEQTTDWTLGRVKIDADSKLMLIIEVQKKDTSGEEQVGFVAIDDFLQENTESCDTLPEKAKPTTPPGNNTFGSVKIQKSELTV